MSWATLFAPMKLLAVHSFAVHGTASLKAFISILGTRVLPVPSLYLSGLTNLPGVVKVQVDLDDLLANTLELAKLKGEKLVVYIGYLGHPRQVSLIQEILHKYRQQILTVIFDPVSGDHGRTYVPEEIVKAWPELLAMADWALPNYTELQLYSGLSPDGEEPQAYLDAFKERFPGVNFIATSLPAKDGLEMFLWHEGQGIRYQHERVPRNYGGSGDVFAAYFFKAHFFEKRPVEEAMKLAAHKTRDILSYSLEQESPDLILSPQPEWNP